MPKFYTSKKETMTLNHQIQIWIDEDRIVTAKIFNQILKSTGSSKNLTSFKYHRSQEVTLSRLNRVERLKYEIVEFNISIDEQRIGDRKWFEMHVMRFCSRIYYPSTKKSQNTLHMQAIFRLLETRRNTKWFNMHKTMRIEFLWWQLRVCERNVHWQQKQTTHTNTTKQYIDTK